MGTKPFVRIVEAPEKAPDRQPSQEPAKVTITENKDLSLTHQMESAIGAESGLKITAPKYTEVIKGNLKVSYAAIGDDYYYQIECLRVPDISGRDILALIIQAFSTVVPETLEVFISEPPQDLNWANYTVIVKKAVGMIGAQQFMEKKLVDKLLDLKLWK